MKAEALPYSLHYTVTEVKPKTLYETQSDIKVKTLVEALDYTLAKDGGRDIGDKNGKVKVNALLNSVLDMQASD